MDFDFATEMVYGKKHLQKVDFDKTKYNLASIVSKHFGYELDTAHLMTEVVYPVFKELGKDSHTVFHKKFYSGIDSKDEWPEFTKTYHSLLSEVVLPYLGLEEALVQKYPSFRVHLPGNVAIVVNHFDADENHGHPVGEINMIYALTNMFGTNTVKVDKMPRLGEYVSLDLKQGELISFNGNLCSHYNMINEEGKTRMSFDFRILPLNYYKPEYARTTVTTGKKYTEGGYYIRMKSAHKLPKLFIDKWDLPKNRIRPHLIKYGLSDPFELVDLFEKRVAEFCGAKYAASLDCATNGLFLALKWYKAEGNTVILPSRTWISVPNCVLRAGAKVKFEDVEWDTSYQLKPYPIYDSAVCFNKGMHKGGTVTVVSFHIRKPLPISKGGCVLTDDYHMWKWLKTISNNGRSLDASEKKFVMYKDDVITTKNTYNMYMEPEKCATGLDILNTLDDVNPVQDSSGKCRDLSKMGLFDE